MSEYITINEASELCPVLERTILNQIKAKKARAYHDGRRWLVSKEDFLSGKAGNDRRSVWHKEYEVDGKRVYREEEGRVSATEAAKRVGINAQQVYYGIRKGFLPAERCGAVWVVKIEDVERYKEERVKGFASHPNSLRRQREKTG